MTDPRRAADLMIVLWTLHGKENEMPYKNEESEIIAPNPDRVLGWMAVKVTEALEYVDKSMEIEASICLMEALKAYKVYMTQPTLVKYDPKAKTD